VTVLDVGDCPKITAEYATVYREGGDRPRP
jgi:hypothetical protein